MSPLNSHLPSKSACPAREEDLSGTGMQFTWRELAILGGAGLTAALAIAFVQTPIRIPGHAILKAAVPFACGMALVSKPLAGTVAASASLFTAAVLLLAGVGNLQAAAVVSLSLTGPAFDWALNRSHDTSRFAALTRFALAGFAVNIAAFVVRFGTAFWQAEGWHPLNFRTLGTAAIVSFALCGIVAGIFCGELCRQRKLR
jgi:hypothetical protein